MEAWEVGAREAIRDTLARYVHLVDRGRLDEATSLFAEDARLDVGAGRTATGRAAIRALFAGTGERLAAGGRPPPPPPHPPRRARPPAGPHARPPAPPHPR